MSTRSATVASYGLSRRLKSSLILSGVRFGHTVTPSPDGRYIVAETEYRHAPLRIFDLQPALDGRTEVIQ